MTRAKSLGLALVIGLLYQQLQARAPDLTGRLWESLMQVVVPGYLSIEIYIVSWDLLQNLLVAAIAVALLFVLLKRVSAVDLFAFCLPILAFELWHYATWWGAFGPTEQDFWRNVLDAATSLLFPALLWATFRFFFCRSAARSAIHAEKHGVG